MNFSLSLDFRSVDRIDYLMENSCTKKVSFWSIEQNDNINSVTILIIFKATSLNIFECLDPLIFIGTMFLKHPFFHFSPYFFNLTKFFSPSRVVKITFMVKKRWKPTKLKNVSSLQGTCKIRNGFNWIFDDSTFLVLIVEMSSADHLLVIILFNVPHT